MVMPSLRTALLAGAAAIFGFAGVAPAQTPNTHWMTVQLPGGGTAQIRYVGDVAPQVIVSSGPAAVGNFLPMAPVFGPDSPFAMLDRISAAMDREAAALFRRAEALAAQPWTASGGLTEAALGTLPPGTRGFSYVSTLSSNGACTRTTEISSTGNGSPPRVVTHSSGNCGPEPNAGTNAGSSAPGAVRVPVTPAPKNRSDVLWTRNDTAQPYAGMVQQAAAR
jgi:hypothetical protein